MSAPLILKFAVHLQDKSDSTQQGVLFHRWFPKGERDAISLTLGLNLHLKLWFEQSECRKSQLDDHGGVPSEIIPNLGKLEAGPLKGSLELPECSKEELDALQEGKVGDPSYIRLGKRVVQDLLCPPLSRFIDILRINYGQYWIRELPSWDSRMYSLGAYCGSILNLRHSTDGGKTWTAFRPDHPVLRGEALFAGPEHFTNYLTQEDWQTVQEKVRAGYVPSTAARILAKSHELFDSGNHSYAFVEGITALEVAIGELIRNNFPCNLPVELKTFKDLGVKQKFTSTAAVGGLLNERDVYASFEPIRIRNQIIHEGITLHGERRKEFYGLLGTVGKLLHLTGGKFGSSSSGNLEMSRNQWEQIETVGP